MASALNWGSKSLAVFMPLKRTAAVLSSVRSKMKAG